MRKSVGTLLLLFAVVLELPVMAVTVRGYTRKDGTYVRSYTRRSGGSPSSGGASYYSGGMSFVTSGAVRSTTPWGSGLGCCRAIYACGTRCNRYVKSGEEYCSEHMGYDPNSKPRLKVVKLPQNDKERLRSTREKLDVVRKCIDYYSDRRGGELPCDLATLMAGNPTYMAPPLKDAWGVPFVVALLDEGLDVRSAGVDGELGNEDDIVLIMER